MENLQDWIIVIAIALAGGLWERIKAARKKSMPTYDDAPQQSVAPVHAPSALSTPSPRTDRKDRKGHDVRPELPPEGECAIPHLAHPAHQAPEGASESITASPDPAREAALAAHYARWRQAVLDSQVLPPKFKD